MLSGKLILLLILSSLILVGCSDKITEDQYIGLRYENIGEGKQLCELKGMKYLTIDMKSFEHTDTVCYTSSPFKLYVFSI